MATAPERAVSGRHPVFYYQLKRLGAASRRRAVEGLQRLRAQLTAELPAKSLNENLLLASWNVREFDSRKFGGRLPEAMHYIAEIVSRFDLVAVQEVREDLRALERVHEILGAGSWDYLVTDVTYGRQGNGERLAFLYDTRKVRFTRVAGEIVLPSKSKSSPVLQMARTPYVCSFQAGWTRFDLCTVHIYYGASKPDDPQRLAEVDALARLLSTEVARQPDDPMARNVIMLGDFNIFDRATDETMKRLEAAGFVVPPEIRATTTNALGNKQYDQIAYLRRDGRFALTGRGGVVDYYKSVFREADEDAYALDRGGKGSSFRDWRTYQMSDHRVLWVELDTDFTAEYLDALLQSSPPPLDPSSAPSAVPTEAPPTRAPRRVRPK
ncbi:MAG: endonuclease/exonuclease/phosphatase family protein [Planctomycetes bacterium]|nr:endonuclease/exonuclease/phosphatase family protein [Planctomycetota bacterium]